MKKLLILLLALPSISDAQPVINSWILNKNGKTASYWAQNGTAQNPSYVFTTTTDSADILKICYNNDSVWIRCKGMTDNMGQFKNPGTCVAQNYVFRFPRNPQAATTKTTSPMIGAIGLLLNGVPIFGLSNANSWTGTTNAGPQAGGQGIWNVEVYKSEGFVLDTAFGAHPQQQGAYHTHATPYRLYKNIPSTQHSPIIGYAFDGYPVYGPYGYSDPMDVQSGITRMKSGYSLRNITTRTTLPSGATATQVGPPVSATYPIGTYCEDYEWLPSNGGDLDAYNGRFCITPDYPNGTYAYFITIDANGQAAYPYIIGPQYYGIPDDADLLVTMPNGGPITIPTNVTNCLLPTDIAALSENGNDLKIAPNPAVNGRFQILGNGHHYNQVMIFNVQGQKVYEHTLEGDNIHPVQLPAPGIYFVRCSNDRTGQTVVQKIISE